MGDESRLSTQLCVNLKVVSQVGEHQKLTSTPDGFLVVQDPSRLQWLFRWMNGDTRFRTFKHVEAVTQTAMMQVRQGNDKDGFILENLGQCVDGLRNLKRTYVGDHLVVASFEHLLEVLEKFLEKRLPKEIAAPPPQQSHHSPRMLSPHPIRATEPSAVFVGDEHIPPLHQQQLYREMEEETQSEPDEEGELLT